MYVNYHTSKFPAGELRGQVLFADSGLAVLVGDQEGPSYCGNNAPGFSASAGWGTVQLGTNSVTLTLRTTDFLHLVLLKLTSMVQQQQMLLQEASATLLQMLHLGYLLDIQVLHALTRLQVQMVSGQNLN